MIAPIKRAFVTFVWRLTTPSLAKLFAENEELARRNAEMKQLVKDLEDERDQLAQVALSASDLHEWLESIGEKDRRITALGNDLKRMEVSS